MAPSLFHLSIPVKDIDSTIQFYVHGLNCSVGRQSPVAITLNFYGHQLVAQVTTKSASPQTGIYPRHFGLVCGTEKEWNDLRNRATTHGLKFFREPRQRFSGTPLEHQTFFLEDPSHNLLEFKYYTNANAVFGEHTFSEVGDTQERDIQP